MYERMLDKARRPSPQDVRRALGEAAYALLCELEAQLQSRYRLAAELRFPFGDNYGWGYKYSHGTFHLCYAFFEQGAFTVMVQVGDARVPALERALPSLSAKARNLWQNRYPCGERGGWVNVRVLEGADLADALQFIAAKKAPKP